MNMKSNSDNFNEKISDNEEEDLEFEEYKRNLDREFEEKRKNLEVFHKEDLLEIENNEKREIKRIQEEHDNKMKMLEVNFNNRLSQETGIIDEEFLNYKYESESNRNITDSNLKLINEKKHLIKDLDNEIYSLKEKLSEYKSNNKNPNQRDDDYSLMYESEVKKMELEYNNELNEYQNELESELQKKKQKLRNQYLNKKIEYETQLKIQSDESQPSETLFLKNQKEIISKNYQIKLDQFKENLMSYYQSQIELEKEKILIENNDKISSLKNNFERTKKMYELQNTVYMAEQLLYNNSNLVTKLKSMFSNKNSIVKNLIEFSYYQLKKKIFELESNEYFKTLPNKEELIVKIAEILTYILYEQIYEIVIDELDNSKGILSKSIEEVTKSLEKIVSCFPFQNKIQLSMLILNNES